MRLPTLLGFTLLYQSLILSPLPISTPTASYVMQQLRCLFDVCLRLYSIAKSFLSWCKQERGGYRERYKIKEFGFHRCLSHILLLEDSKYATSTCLCT